jgi:hypothetical protein
MRAVVAALCLFAFAGRAAAQERRSAIAASADVADWHPYLFSSDGDLLRAGRAAVESGVGFNGVPSRDTGLAPDDARSATGWLSGAVGVARRIELDGTIFYAGDPSNGYRVDDTRLEARVALLTPRAHLPVAISLGGGYQADALLEHAATASLDASATLGRLNLTVNVRAAHYFHAGRDPVDVFVTAGAMVRVSRLVRIGAEYVGEELEALVGGDDDNAPAGRHYVGPTAALFWAGGHLRVSATAGALLTPGQQGPLVRAALAWIY